MDSTKHINRVSLSGEIVTPGELIVTSHNFELLRYEVKVQRLSGAFDTIPVVIPKSALDLDLQPGDWISVKGSYRSHNNPHGPGPKLVLQVFTRNIERVDPGTNENEITLSGVLCREPTHRMTPLNREVTDVMLAVKTGRNTQYIPVITWGNIAKSCAALNTGDSLALNGRIQSRVYQKKIDENTVEPRVAYEVSMMTFYKE